MNYKVYGKPNCAACEQAKALIASRGLGYEYVNVMTTPMAMDMFRQNGWKSFPQIFVNGVHIGGLVDLQKREYQEQMGT